MSTDEFIDKLSIETSLSHQQSEWLAGDVIDKAGNIVKAVEIYEADGIGALLLYKYHLDFGIIY